MAGLQKAFLQARNLTLSRYSTQKIDDTQKRCYLVFYQKWRFIYLLTALPKEQTISRIITAVNAAFSGPTVAEDENSQLQIATVGTVITFTGSTDFDIDPSGDGNLSENSTDVTNVKTGATNVFHDGTQIVQGLVTYSDGSTGQGQSLILYFEGKPYLAHNTFNSFADNPIDFAATPTPVSFTIQNTNSTGAGPVLNGWGAVSFITSPAGAASVCFTRDTMIDTDLGEVAVQDLAPGMMVRTRDNGFQPIRWVGMTPAKDRAVRIKAGALGNARDLVVSPRHRMVLEGWQLEMLFQHDHALVTAQELVNDSTIVMDAMADVEYYHVMFDAHEIIFAEGAATESFHPDQASMGSMDAAAREEIFALFPELKDGTYRAEAAPNLSATQAAYVGKNLDAFVN